MSEHDTDVRTRRLADVIDLVGAHCFMQTLHTKNRQTLESSDITEAVDYANLLSADVAVPFLRGAPGGGKTTSMFSLCQKNNWGIVSIHFALRPLEELGGVPDICNIKINGKELKGTIWTLPDFMKNLYEISAKYSGEDQLVILLLDDFHLCGPSHTSLLYEIFTERTLRGYKFPDNVAFVLAGNTSAKAHAKVMNSAIVNRCALMPVHTDFDDWHKDFAMPAGIHLAVISFLKSKNYSQFFHEPEQVDTGWGSPRSWSRFANFLKKHEEWTGNMMTADLCLYLAEGYVGRKAASEFTNYYSVYSKFDCDNIIRNADKFKIPDEDVNAYALVYALASKYMGVSNKERKAMSKNFALIVKKYLETPAVREFGLLMMKEIIHTEKAMNKKSITHELLAELRELDNKLVFELLEKIQSL